MAVAQGDIIVESVNNLARQVNLLAQTRSIEKTDAIITPFNGDSKLFDTWINEIEKFTKLADLPPLEKRRIAFQTSRGYVSDFISRSLTLRPDQTWEALY